MKISKDTMKLLLEINNAIYDDIKLEFLYHSNKLEGSTYEVEELIKILLETKITSIEDIANFHQKFEHIHPFQDGNGRIGRFIILRQCLENNIDLIAIDDEYNKEYREALYKAQTTGSLEQLIQVLKRCQERLSEKMQSYIPTIEQVSEEVD